MAGKYNIKAQYAAWMVTVTLGATVALTGVHVWRAIDTEEAASRRVAQVVARAAAHAIQQGLMETNLAIIVRELDRVVSDNEVEYCAVLDASDQALFKPSYATAPVNLIMASQTVVDGNRKLGLVEIGIAPTSMVSRTLGTLLWSLGVGAGLLGIALWVSLFASEPVVVALQSLQDFVRRVGRGEAKGEVLDSDLTEVDRTAQEITTLMRRVEEQQDRLERAQQQVKSTQKEMDEYTYVISHDLKEPLRGIEGFSKFLADGYRDKLDDDGRHFIDMIRNSALRMQRLINDLLKFSRLSQQKHPMEMVGLNSMLMHVRVNLQYALDAKKVDLRVDKLPILVCDATALTEVFHNLITNAIKYNDKPLPVIEVGASERRNPDTGAPEYLLHVRDNGAGIKPEYHEKIFQIFQRLHSDQEGTGIGLSIVKRVIEWHGGRVWVESEEGKGTTFFFTLPKREAAKTGALIETPVTPPEGSPPRAPTV